jgi:hypothetical protein
MSEHHKTKLREVFSKLDSDLSHDLAFTLADKCKVSYEEIIKEYEAWQVE